MRATPPRHPNDAEAQRRILKKAKEFQRLNPPAGPAVFTLPDPLAIVDPDSQHYPHVTRRCSI